MLKNYKCVLILIKIGFFQKNINKIYENVITFLDSLFVILLQLFVYIHMVTNLECLA